MPKGSCLCGNITYTVDGPLRPVIACHCRQCRKSSGHHVAATSAARSDVSVHGEVTWYRSSPTARRGFCGTCGSQMFWDGQGQNLSIFAGTFEEDAGLRLAGHIFCADKGGYYDINDDLPHAQADDPNLTTQVP
ncbi:GFA family protein [uncultured Litoreibacter sp.]|uniref:GFA family protein n=1 Tax=uncultured Litoreibacter sp. TaxID=1392394 RepID=UPI0026179274|nr:GFA family protein [uncultured Litoreibacter sp.]